MVDGRPVSVGLSVTGHRCCFRGRPQSSQRAVSGAKTDASDRRSWPSWTSRSAARVRYSAAWSGRRSSVSTSADDWQAPTWCSRSRSVRSNGCAASARNGSRVMTSSLGLRGQSSSQHGGAVGSVGGQISRVREVPWLDLSQNWTLARLHFTTWRHGRPGVRKGSVTGHERTPNAA